MQLSRIFQRQNLSILCIFKPVGIRFFCKCSGLVIVDQFLKITQTAGTEFYGEFAIICCKLKFEKERFKKQMFVWYFSDSQTSQPDSLLHELRGVVAHVGGGVRVPGQEHAVGGVCCKQCHVRGVITFLKLWINYNKFDKLWEIFIYLAFKDYPLLIGLTNHILCLIIWGNNDLHQNENTCIEIKQCDNWYGPILL